MGVTEPRPPPVIINLFAVLYQRSHFVFPSAPPFSGLLGGTEILLFLGRGRWKEKRQWSETQGKEGLRAL